MNFGYLLIVHQEKHSEVDYAKMAYALALSIKNTQKPGYDKVALVINDESLLKNFNSPWVFDHIMSWDEKDFWNGRAYMDRLSPFDHTVCLDVDMLFLRDYSHWVDYLIENCELYVASHAITYRGEKINSDYYRKAFTKNDLPNLYSFYTFFTKNSELCNEFFALARYISEYPNEFSNHFLSNHKPKIMGTDEAFALSAKILGIEDEISFDLPFPKVLHLKPMVQNWPWPADHVDHHVGLYLDKNAKMKIGNYQQTGLVHYVLKDFMNNEHLNILEEIAWKKN